MSSETIAIGRLAPDQCQSCSTHTCGRADSPLAESSPLADSSPLANSSPLAQSSSRRGAPVLHEVPVYEIDNGEHSRTCIRKILIATILILIILILLVIILRSIF